MGNQDINNAILTDKKGNGKERPWAERKEQSRNVSNVLEWGGMAYAADKYEKEHSEAVEGLRFYQKFCTPWFSEKSKNMLKCGDYLEFTEDEEGRKRLYRAWFCKDRLCPMCNWRRSVKLRGQMLKILMAMKDRDIKGRPIFITFTMKNVSAENISQSFSDFAISFNRLMKYKTVKSVCIGSIRSSEITYNKKRNDYNTHIHCLLWMTPDYFAGRNYLSQEKWTLLWQRAARLDYTPVVNVKAVKQQAVTETDPTGYIKAVLEIAKYTAKPTAIPGLNGVPWKASDKVKMEMGRRIAALELGLYRRRLIGFFGIFKDLHKELNLDDTEDGDLVGADEESTEGKTINTVRYKYNFEQHNYFFVGAEQHQKRNHKQHYEGGFEKALKGETLEEYSARIKGKSKGE